MKVIIAVTMFITIIAAIIMMSIFGKQEPVVRPATQAGRFYDGNPQSLSHEVDSFLTLHANDKQYENVAAIIVPHAGYYFSGNVAATAYMSLPKDKRYKHSAKGAYCFSTLMPNFLA